MNTSAQEFLVVVSVATVILTGCTARQHAPHSDTAKQMQAIKIERTIGAPVDRVWKSWTDNSDLAQWLTEKANVHPVVGGAYELFWEPEHPDRNSTRGCKITEFDPSRKLTFTWLGPVQFAEFMNVGEHPPTHVTVIFEEKAGKTLVRLVHAGWGEGPQWHVSGS